MSEEAIINFNFLPGFSTKDVSTEVSGRGVGMDVVKSNVAKLNGYVEIFTEKIRVQHSESVYLSRSQ